MMSLSWAARRGACMFKLIRAIIGSSRPSGPARRGSPVRLSLELCDERVVLSAPTAPTGLVAVGASPTTIALTWNASTDASVASYSVYEQIRHVIHQPKG